MARTVYENGKSFDNVKELKKSIVHAWNTIPQRLILKLVFCMKSRIFEGIKAMGDTLDTEMNLVPVYCIRNSKIHHLHFF